MGGRIEKEIPVRHALKRIATAFAAVAPVTRSRRPTPPAKLLLGFVVVACVFGASATSLWAGGPQYTEWSQPVNLGPTINTTSVEGGAAISKDGLSIYFHSDRPGGSGGTDILVSQRESVDDAWGTPVNLGPTVNSASNDQVPAFSRDGHWMFFNSDRPGGFGGFDIWGSWRPQTHDDFGWQAPVNLGPNVNTAFGDHGANYFANDDAGAPQLYFGSDRQGPPGNTDFYASELQPDGSWGPATRIPELSSIAAAEGRPNLRHDGLEVFFFSNRAGGSGLTDLWTATRDTVDAPWSTPVNLGPIVNTSVIDGQPYLSADRETLFFTSPRPGGLGMADLWMTTRSKAHGHS
jgi:hypothetical protein